MLAAVALLSIVQVRSVADEWLGTMTVPTADVNRILDQMDTEDLQWVQPPFGEENFVSAAVARNVKIAWFDRPWTFRGRPEPKAVLVASRQEEPELVFVGRFPTI